MILGIDPGLNGAYAILDGRHAVALDHLPAHRTQHGKTGKVRSELDLHALKDVLAAYAISHVFLERVAARPGQGVSSMFRFGQAAGGLYGLLVGLALPTSFVTPQQWQKHHGIGGVPDAAQQRAVQLYPVVSAHLSRKRDDQRADALLIAVYGLAMLSRMTAAPLSDAVASESLVPEQSIPVARAL